MTGATIDVQHPPAGWSHLQGPLLHVLVAIDPGDDRYARASEAAAGGDLDDVLDVLASAGMRRTPGFVAVAGASRPRVVTHGDGYAVLTSSRGTLEVRPHHARVWSDLEADEDVHTVALRVSPSALTPTPTASTSATTAPRPAADSSLAAHKSARADFLVNEPEPAPEPEPEPEPEPGPEPVRAPSRAPVVEPAPEAGDDLIAAVPWRRPPVADEDPAADDDQLVPDANPKRDPNDPDRTVDRAALLAASQNQGPNAHTGPTVLAALCTRGHLNPPTNATCRVCGRPVPEQQPYETPRPPLGILRLSTGDTVTLDRGVIMGRAPQAPPGLPPDLQPHVVRLASPQRDLSRNHVQVVLEGWQVVVRDLDTTNGTTITPKGGRPQRLRGGEAQVIDLGTSVNLADEVTFVYEPEAGAGA